MVTPFIMNLVVQSVFRNDFMVRSAVEKHGNTVKTCDAH